MAGTEKDIQKSEKGIFRLLEFISESVGWLQIVLAPLLIGLGIGAAVYFSGPTTIRLVIGISIAASGLIIGLFLATKAWKSKEGTMRSLSRTMASPDLDKEDDEIDGKQANTKKGRP